MSWTHIRALLAIDDPLKRQSTRTLHQKIDGMLFERTAIAKRPTQVVEQALENPPLGLILCADKNEEQIELLELTNGSVRVASYLTELPPRELLERKLIESIEHARARAGVSNSSLAAPDDP